MLKSVVESWGFQALIKPDPRASDTYEVRDSDVIFLDIMMPHVSGLNVLEQLARQNVKSSIVVISGQGDILRKAEHLAFTRSLNIIGILEKPFRLLDIKDVMVGISPSIAIRLS